MTRDDERIRALFRRAFDDLHGEAQAEPRPASSARRWSRFGPTGTVGGAVVAAAVVVLLAVAMPAREQMALKPVIPSSERPQPDESPQLVAPTHSASPSRAPNAGQPDPTPQRPRPESMPPSPSSSSSSRPSRSACHSDWAARAKPPGLTVTLTADKTAASPGEVVRFTMTVRNDGPAPIHYEHGQPVATVKMDGARGEEWRSGSGLVTTQEIRPDTLGPGESRSETFVWNVSSTLCGEGPAEPTPAGRYQVSGAWHTSQGGWVAEPLTFTVH